MAKKRSTAKRSTRKRATSRKTVTKKKAAPKRKASAKRATPKRKSTRKRAAPRAASTPTVTQVRIPQVRVKTKWNNFALAYTLAILAAADVLIASLVYSAGYWQSAVELLQQIYISYTPTVAGTVAGMAEGAIYGLIAGFLIGWLYNKFN